MINPGMLLKLKQAQKTFEQNHPKFPMFLRAVGKDAMTEGTVIEINVTTADGRNLATNLKLQQSDIEFLQEMMAMTGSK